MAEIDSRKLDRSITYLSDELIEEALEPMKRERKNNITWLDRAGRIAGALAAAFALTVTVNAAFPAFAEELPLIGGVFAWFNGRTAQETPPNVNEQVIQRAGDVDAVITAAEDGPVTVSLEQVSCDGLTLNLGLRVICEDRELNERNTNFVTCYALEKNTVVTVNGQPAGLSFAVQPTFRKTSVPGEYVGVVPCDISHMDLDGGPLQVAVSIPALRYESWPAGAVRDFEAGKWSDAVRYGDTAPLDWKAEFSVGVTRDARVYAPGASFGGVTLEKVTLGDAQLIYRVTMPADMSTQAVMLPLDDRGNEVGRGSVMTGGAAVDGVWKTVDFYLAAPEAGTVSLTFCVADMSSYEPGTDLEEYWEQADILGSYTLRLD